LRIRYDPEVDAAYIYFKDEVEQVTTIRLTEDIAVDFGPGEEVYGIEVLSASEHMGLKPGAPYVDLENLAAKST